MEKHQIFIDGELYATVEVSNQDNAEFLVDAIKVHLSNGDKADNKKKVTSERILS